MLENKISVILPAFDDAHHLKAQINSINNQSLKPSEIILVDSSSNNLIEDAISSISSDVPVKYYRIGRGFKNDRYLFKLSKIFTFLKNKYDFTKKRAYPSEAINFGVSKSDCNILAFVDMSTIPKPTWLSNYKSLLLNGYDVIFGTTVYEHTTKLQKLIHYSTFGNNVHESSPGTMIWFDKYTDNKILEGFRSGVDLEWRNRIKQNLSTFTPQESFLSYNSLSIKLINFLKKMFIYQLHSAPLRIQKNSKDVFFGFFLVFLTLIISRWNYLVGWESILYIPHVTKIFLIILNVFFLQLILLRRMGFNFFSEVQYPILNTIIKILLFFSLFMVMYRWNAIVAEWIESSRYYIPHLTKLFLGTSILMAVGYRGIFFPLRNGIKKENLSMSICLQTGIIGFLGDLVKAPGFIIGSIFFLFTKKNSG